MTENENAHKELTQKFMMFEQQIRLIQEQLQAVEQALIDLESIHFGLDELVGKKDNEILSQIGRGIYAKAKLVSEELIVDIGGKNFVKKSIPDTQSILKGQIEKLKEIKEELNLEMDKINEDLTKTFMDAQGKNEE
jgi:prefoldin alpha subunit